MRLGFGEAILIASLVALGWVNLRDQRAVNRRDLVGMLRRERELQRDIVRLRQGQRTLEKQSYALANDPYYVERTVREEFGWQPVEDADSSRLPAEHLAAMATARAPERPPLPVPSQPLAADPPAPVPPPPLSDQPARQLLAMLGYGSAMDFQRKMMSGGATGALDGTTVARAQGLLAMLERTGSPSVRAFQTQQGLAADGVVGKLTEQRLREVLRDRQARDGRRARAARSAVVIHGGARDRTRPGG